MRQKEKPKGIIPLGWAPVCAGAVAAHYLRKVKIAGALILAGVLVTGGVCALKNSGFIKNCRCSCTEPLTEGIRK